MRSHDETTVEADDAGNDERSGAEPLVFQHRGGGVEYAHLLTHLSTDADMDHFSVTVDGTQQVAVTCGARFYGSGVVGLRVELLASDGAGIAAANEATNPPVNETQIPLRTLSEAGTYYVRLSGTDHLEDVTGDYVRCAVS